MKRRRGGFVQVAIMHLLKESSMHGYQIMKELEERSNGAYSASAGTIYPALQELVDQKLIDLHIDSGKKIYSLNENGSRRIGEIEEFKREEGDFWDEWEKKMRWRNSEESIQLRAAIERWEKQFHKTIKHTRGNREGVLDLIKFINEMTEQLKQKSI